MTNNEYPHEEDKFDEESFKKKVNGSLLGETRDMGREMNNDENDEDEDYLEHDEEEDIPEEWAQYQKALRKYKRDMKHKYEKQLRAYSRDLRKQYRSAATDRIPPVPPAPPVPPMPPLPPSHEDPRKVIGIRGLNPQTYKEIRRHAKKLGINVSDLINDIFSQYLSNSKDFQTIRNVDSLEITEHDLIDLGYTSLNLEYIGTLTFSPEVTIDSFNRIISISQVNNIRVPAHLYLPLLRKVRNCNKIEKFSGESIPQIVTKEFNSDIKLSRSFFEYFIEDKAMVALIANTDLDIEEDVTLDLFKSVVNSLTVHGSIRIPKHLEGWILAKAECHDDIDVYD